MNRWQHVSLVSVALLLVTSCQSSNNSPTATASGDDGTITVGTTQQPRTLDPADAYELRSIALIRNLSDRLYTYDPGSTEIKPQLATALPQVSADSLSYTIPIRQGVVFHDGTTFDAAAMAFSLQRFIQNKGKPSFLLSERVESVKATSAYELTIKLKKPFAAFPSMLAFPGTCAVSPKAYEIAEGKFKATSFVGTGPYVLKEYGTDRVKLVAFDRYWGAKPLNRSVNIQIFSNNSANLYNSFRTGAVDVAFQSLEPDQVKSLEEGAKAGNWQSIAIDGSVTSYLILNVLQKPLDNPLVRQALAALVDRPTINERILYGQGKPLYSIVPSTFSVSQPGFKNAYGDGNIAKAKQLLTQAGFSPQNPAKIQIWYPSGSTPRRLTAGFLRAYARQKLGGMLELEPNTIESASFFKYASKNIYPATLQDWYPDFLDPDNFVQPFLECPKGTAATGCKAGGSQTQGSFYYSDRMNQLIAAQGKESDPAKRQQIYADIQNQLIQDVPLIPLWQTKDFVFAKKGMSGINIDPLQNLLYSGMKK
ncbi:ABC transporter substrate-binding protein [Chamaesiphon sp. GL140_3_metabinner_50]|uniref:ABC transporter substrate-binding protein n=1 Tax=Chamaesiphon sp. GL140_3_metabinner_50 TaxID=2970812 RepID=UPI0025F2150A|nr:ABC transporter substrate-binding protein [Chamaesiphon sp. GL140_3_metabinner_50]